MPSTIRQSIIGDGKVTDGIQQPNHGLDDDVDDDNPDTLFAELENEDDSKFRAARLQELGDEVRNHHQATRNVERNTVITLRTDDEVLRYTTEVETVVLHFLHPEFSRCTVMDRHLETVAEAQHAARDMRSDVKWARVDVKDAPFVVEKMGIRILPCVVGFRDGVVVGRVVGFEGLLWGGERSKEDGEEVARALEERLVEWKLLGRAVVRAGDARVGSDGEEEVQGDTKGRRSIRDTKRQTDDDDDEDDDWD